MAQHDMVVDNAAGAVFRADLNAALQALASNNMAATAPSVTYGGMFWLDISTSPATLRMRNNGNTEWINCGNLTELSYLAGVTSGIQMQLNAKAPLSSPGFTGTPTAPHPTSGDRTNKIATMAMFTNEFVASFAANGYQKLPSGLIIQWGLVFSGTWAHGQNIAATFPIAFPNTVLNYKAWGNSDNTEVVSGAYPTVANMKSVTKTGFTASLGTISGATMTNAALRYFVIGY